MDAIRLRGKEKLSGRWKYWIIDGLSPVTVNMDGIDLDTVGKYIGKQDSSHSHIYEGDILEDSHGNSGVVQWNRKSLTYECQSVKVMEHSHIAGNIYDADLEKIRIRKILEREIPESELSTRAYNSLKALGLAKLCDVVKYSRKELSKERNIGDKSMIEIETMIRNNNLFLGMDIAIYGFRIK